MAELSEADKRLAAQMRERARLRDEYIAKHGVPPEGNVATAPADPDKHADAIGLDDDGNPFPSDEDRALARAERMAEATGGLALPAGTAAGISASVEPGGFVLYRDDRHGFSVGIPGRPKAIAADGADAAWSLLGGALTLRITVAAAGGALADEVRARAIALAGDPPFELTFGQPNITAAGMASKLSGRDMLEVDVLGGRGAIATLTLAYDAAAVDPVTAAAARAAIVASAAFTAEPRRELTSPWPESPWLEAALPLRLRADHPRVPAPAKPAQLVGELLGAIGPLPAHWTLRSNTRGAVERALSAAIGDDAAQAAIEQLTTVHDVRGLAFTILST